MRRYILWRKTLFTTKQKTLKRQKKAKRQHLKTMDCGLFFLLKKYLLLFFGKIRGKNVINGGVKKKWYHRWGEKHNNFFGNFFIILASYGGREKLVLKTFFSGEATCSFCWRSKFFSFSTKISLLKTMLLLQMILGCCKWVCKWLAHDFKTC